MLKIKKLLLGLLSLFYCSTVLPTVSYSLLSDKDGNLILVLGENYLAIPELEIINEIHVDKLIEAMENGAIQKHCYLELLPSMFKCLSEQKPIEKGFGLPKTLALLGEHITKAKNITFYPAGVWERKNCALEHIIGSIQDFFAFLIIQGENPPFVNILKKLIIRSDKVGNVGDWIVATKYYISKTQELLQFYPKVSPAYKLIERKLIELNKNVETAIEKYFKDQKLETSLYDAIEESFKDCKNQNDAKDKAVEIYEDLISKIDYLIAQINFVHKALQGQAQSLSRILFVVKEHHALKLVPMLQEVGYKLITNKSIYTNPKLYNSFNFTPEFHRGLERILAAFASDKAKIRLVENLCSNCTIKIGDKRCGGCKTAHYCSLDCQRAHWPTHEKLCKPKVD